MEEGKRPIKIDVAGKDKSKWAKHKSKLKEKLYEIFDDIMSFEINLEKGRDVGEELQEVPRNILKNFLGNLQAPWVNNEKKKAEIDKLFEEKKKLREEAEGVRLDNIKKRLELQRTIMNEKLKRARIIIILLKDDPDVLILSSRIDEFSEAISEKMKSSEQRGNLLNE